MFNLFEIATKFTINNSEIFRISSTEFKQFLADELYTYKNLNFNLGSNFLLLFLTYKKNKYLTYVLT